MKTQSALTSRSFILIALLLSFLCTITASSASNDRYIYAASGVRDDADFYFDQQTIRYKTLPDLPDKFIEVWLKIQYKSKDVLQEIDYWKSQGDAALNELGAKYILESLETYMLTSYIIRQYFITFDHRYCAWSSYSYDKDGKLIDQNKLPDFASQYFNAPKSGTVSEEVCRVVIDFAKKNDSLLKLHSF